jgi:predicted transcriptional regulator
MEDRFETQIKEGTLTLAQICELLEGTIVCGEQHVDAAVSSACGCDLMSDVLAFTKPGSVLLTGLTNAQVVRTADMLDLKGVVFVRSKKPDESVLEMARQLGLAVILSPYPLYESCGRLYKAGLAGCQEGARPCGKAVEVRVSD